MSALDAAIAAAPHVLLPVGLVLAGYVTGRIHGALFVVGTLFGRRGGDNK